MILKGDWNDFFLASSCDLVKKILIKKVICYEIKKPDIIEFSIYHAEFYIFKTCPCSHVVQMSRIYS